MGTTKRPAGEAGYSAPQVCKLVGVSYRQLDHWDHTDLLKPEIARASGSGSRRRYSYRDLVQLKIIKGLLDAGVTLKTARKAIDSLRSEHGVEWQRASLVLNGAQSVVARDGDHLIDLVRDGQGVLNVVSLGPMVGELDAAILELHPGTSDAADDAPRRAAQGG